MQTEREKMSEKRKALLEMLSKHITSKGNWRGLKVWYGDILSKVSGIHHSSVSRAKHGIMICYQDLEAMVHALPEADRQFAERKNLQPAKKD